MRCRPPPFAAALALALTVTAAMLGAGGCQDETTPEEPQSIVVITVNFAANVPAPHQIRVAAHLGGTGDVVLLFPNSPTSAPIRSGSTLALLIPITRMGLLDLGVTGLDANGTPISTGNGQATIVVGGRVDVTISLQ